MIAESTVKTWGHSLGVVIPNEIVKKMELKKGETVSIDLVKKKKIDAFGMCKGAKPFEREADHRDKEW